MRISDWSSDVCSSDLGPLLRVGDVVFLRGGLGAGKTAFAREVLHARGVAGEAPSPTFNLVLVYDTAQGVVWHFDLYRIETPEEAFELGLEDALVDGEIGRASCRDRGCQYV